MKSLEWYSLSLTAGLLLAVAGCYSSSPYTPYGYGNPYAVPPGTTMPNGSYMAPPTQGYPAGAAPSGAVLGPPTTFAAPGTLPQGTSPSASAPDWRSSPATGSPEPAHNPKHDVPEYDTDLFDKQGSLDSYSDGPALVSADAPETFAADPYAQPVQRVANSLAMSTSSQQASSETIVTAAAEDLPVGGLDAASYDQPQELNSTHFAHDPQSYRWLRGVIDFDEEQQTWNIIYALRPSADDVFGGSLVLADDPQLQQLKTGEVVQIEGFVAEHETDNRGKPLYRIESLSRIPTLQASR